MLEFESRAALYKLLSIFDMPYVHWCNTSGWIVVEHMCKQIVEEIRRLIQPARYVVVTVDEVTAINNSSILSVHAYIVQDWVRVLLLISLW